MSRYLWLIILEQVVDYPDWNPYHTAVVVAEAAVEAKCILPTGRTIGGQAVWCTPEFVQVKYLGVAEPGLEGVICVSITDLTQVQEVTQ